MSVRTRGQARACSKAVNIRRGTGGGTAVRRSGGSAVRGGRECAGRKQGNRPGRCSHVSWCGACEQSAVLGRRHWSAAQLRKRWPQTNFLSIVFCSLRAGQVLSILRSEGPGAALRMLRSEGMRAVQQVRHLGLGSRRQPVAAQHVEAAGKDGRVGCRVVGARCREAGLEGHELLR